MKRMMLAVLVVGVCAAPVWAESLWNTSGILTNPANNTVVCDTGALPAAPDGGSTTIGVRMILATTAAALVQIEHRAVDNLSIVATPRAPGGEAQAFSVPANQTLEVRDFQVIIAPGERVRVALLAALTGKIQCTIWSDQ